MRSCIQQAPYLVSQIGEVVRVEGCERTRKKREVDDILGHLPSGGTAQGGGGGGGERRLLPEEEQLSGGALSGTKPPPPSAGEPLVL